MARPPEWRAPPAPVARGRLHQRPELVELDAEPTETEVDHDPVDQQVKQLAPFLWQESLPDDVEAIEEARDVLDLLAGAGEGAKAVFDLAELDAEVVGLSLNLPEPFGERLAAAARRVVEGRQEPLRLGVALGHAGIQGMAHVA